MKYSCGLTTRMKTTEQYFAVRCCLLQVLCYVFFSFADSFPIFSRFFCFPFSLPFFSLYLLPFNLIPFLSTGKDLASALLKTWKSNIHDQLGDLAYFTTILICTQNWKRFFWYSSVRIWSIFKMDTRMDGSVLAVCVSCLSKQSW